MNIQISQILKTTSYLILYWLFCVIIPIFVIYNYKYDGTGIDLPGYLSLYIIFIAPFLFFIPYKLARVKNIETKFYFIFLGLVLPYLVIYFLIYLDFRKNFNPTIL